ncbi:unnamed protein product [marine sediment metagenome]|uniref:Uncharacterized protein n=1 Tax=marine sediment metagenome TaxID=412755 RepID=X0Z330_9ZZZZ
MKDLNIDRLISLSIDDIIENLDSIFKELIQEIESFLSLEVINNFNVTYNDNTAQSINPEVLFYDIGVERTVSNDLVNVTIFNNYKNFIKEIVLREAYILFIPNNLKEDETIHIFITQRLISDLKKLPSIEHWR